jgi:23S rRNA (uracil1939-C5)-methyltransferase
MTWQIEKLVPGGEGIAHLADGTVGFTSGVLPGESVEVRASEHKKGFVRAISLRVLEPSPDRVSPPCAYVSPLSGQRPATSSEPLSGQRPATSSEQLCATNSEQCGGCDWLHIDYAAQLRHKLGILRDALVRTGKLERLPELAIEPAVSSLAYRNRIRLHLERGKVGFRARHSHQLVDIASCSVALPELDQCLARFRQIALAHRECFELFSEAELRIAPAPGPGPTTGSAQAASSAGGSAVTVPRALVRLTPRSAGWNSRERARALFAALESHFAVAIAGEPSDVLQRWPLASGLELAVPADAFVQVNWAVNQRLVSALVREATARGLRSFADLYAGAGNFTLPLLAAGLSGVAVEGIGAAGEAARRSIAELRLPGEVLSCDVVTGIERLVRAGRRFELVVLDPPRAGAAEVVARVVALGARSLAYCACDPVTLARDLKQLREQGFSLDAVRAYDMFPSTHHFETLAWLSRA